MLWLACLLAVRDQHILKAWNARQADAARRAAAGPPPPDPPAPAGKTLAATTAPP